MSDKASGLKHVVRKGKDFTKRILEVPKTKAVYRDTRQLSEANMNTSMSDQDIIVICHEADKKNFYITKIPSHHGRKITYRVLSATYRGARDGAKKAYRVIRMKSIK